MSAHQARRIDSFLAVADEELAAAKQLAPILPRQGAYFLQQSVEKLVRATLEVEQIPAGATHNLRFLADLLPTQHPLKSAFVAFDDLTPASTRYRYPTASGALVPVSADSVLPRIAEVEELVKNVRHYIDRKRSEPVTKDD